MKKVVTIIIVSAVILAGCSISNKSQASNGKSSLSSDASSEQGQSTGGVSEDTHTGLENNYDMFGIPVMSEKNQKIYDKYIKPLVPAYPFLIYPFHESSFTGAFQVANIYSGLVNATKDEWVQASVVEPLVQRCFEISSEEMRSLSSIASYNSDTNAYYIPAVPQTNLPRCRGVVTGSVINGSMLTITTDWYEADYRGAFYPQNKTTSVTNILVLSDSLWRYTSNQSPLIFDEMHTYHDDIYMTYLEAVDKSIILSKTWADANEIDPDNFIMYYYYAVLSPANPYGWQPEMEVQSKEYERYILQYFNTTPEHLRKSSYYNSTKDVYIFKSGIGSHGKTDVLAVTPNNNYLNIAFLQYDLGDNAIREGTIQVEIVGEQWKYVSCYVHNLDG